MHNRAFQYFKEKENPQIFEKVKSLQNQLKCSIEGSKKNIIFAYPKN